MTQILGLIQKAMRQEAIRKEAVAVTEGKGELWTWRTLGAREMHLPNWVEVVVREKGNLV